MPLREQLASGILGIRWTPPTSLEWMKNEEHLAVARDPDRRVGWLVRSFRWPLDLRRVFDDDLRRDLEHETRHIFEANFHKEPPPDGTTTPRSADAGWSPIVDLEHIRVGDAAALQLVWRMHYQPGAESLSGALLIPLADGFVEITAVARVNRTGYRECVLMLSLRPDLVPDDVGNFPSQSEYDDPKHDPLFADHPLSLVRSAVRWMLRDGGLAVTKPCVEAPVGEVLIESVGCTVIPPPRYLMVPREVLPMAPTLVSFARACLGDAEVRLLDGGASPTVSRGAIGRRSYSISRHEPWTTGRRKARPKSGIHRSSSQGTARSFACKTWCSSRLETPRTCRRCATAQTTTARFSESRPVPLYIARRRK